jgi:hypothetical protein
MHLLMIAETILWFVLLGLLWYMRRGEVIWLAGARHRLLRRLPLVRDAADVTG